MTGALLAVLAGPVGIGAGRLFGQGKVALSVSAGGEVASGIGCGCLGGLPRFRSLPFEAG